MSCLPRKALDRDLHRGGTFEVCLSNGKGIEEDRASYDCEELEEGEIRDTNLSSDRRTFDCEELQEGELREDGAFLSGRHVNSTEEVRSSDNKAIEKGDANVRHSTLHEKVVAKDFGRDPRENFTNTKHSGDHQHGNSSIDEILKRIDAVSSERSKLLLSRQDKECQEFKILKKKLELELFENYHSKLSKQMFSVLQDRFEKHMQTQKRKFAVQLVETRRKEDLIKQYWMEKATAGTLEESFDNLPLSRSAYKLEEFKFNEGESSQIVDSLVEAEPLRSIAVQCSSTQLQQIDPVKESEDIPMENESPVCKSISRNSVQFSATSGDSGNDSFSVVEAEEMSSVEKSEPSQSNGAHTMSCEEAGSNSHSSGIALHEEEDGSIVDETPQTVKDAASKHSKVISDDNSGKARPVGKEQEGNNPGCALPGGSHTNIQTELLSSDRGPKYCDRSASWNVNPMPVMLPSSEHEDNNQVETIAVSQSFCNQAACSSQVTELLDVPMQVSMVAHNTQGGQHNQQLWHVVYSQAPPTLNIPPARVHGESLGPSNVQLWGMDNQLPPSSTGPQLSPLNFELRRLVALDDIITRRHEDQRGQLIVQCEKEIAQAKRKRDDLMLNADMEMLQTTKKIDMICDILCKNQMLADSFQHIFMASEKVTTDGVADAGPRTLPQVGLRPVVSPLPAAVSAAQQQMGLCPVAIPSAAVASASVAIRPSSQPSIGWAGGCNVRCPALFAVASHSHIIAPTSAAMDPLMQQSPGWPSNYDAQWRSALTPQQAAFAPPLHILPSAPAAVRPMQQSSVFALDYSSQQPALTLPFDVTAIDQQRPTAPPPPLVHAMVGGLRTGAIQRAPAPHLRRPFAPHLPVLNLPLGMTSSQE